MIVWIFESTRREFPGPISPRDVYKHSVDKREFIMSFHISIKGFYCGRIEQFEFAVSKQAPMSHVMIRFVDLIINIAIGLHIAPETGVVVALSAAKFPNWIAT